MSEGAHEAARPPASGLMDVERVTLPRKQHAKGAFVTVNVYVWLTP